MGREFSDSRSDSGVNSHPVTGVCPVTRSWQRVPSGSSSALLGEQSPLWKLKNQSEIEGFKTRVADGYSVEVELFAGGKRKTLRYSNPEAYEQVENLQFRAALHLLLSNL